MDSYTTKYQDYMDSLQTLADAMDAAYEAGELSEEDELRIRLEFEREVKRTFQGTYFVQESKTVDDAEFINLDSSGLDDLSTETILAMAPPSMRPATTVNHKLYFSTAKGKPIQQHIAMLTEENMYKKYQKSITESKELIQDLLAMCKEDGFWCVAFLAHFRERGSGSGYAVSNNLHWVETKQGCEELLNELYDKCFWVQTTTCRTSEGKLFFILNVGGGEFNAVQRVMVLHPSMGREYIRYIKFV